MRKTLVLAAVLTAISLPALAQFNSTGTQAGGPLAGQQRAMGAPGGEPASNAMPTRMGGKRMMKSRSHRKMMMQRRMRRGM